MTLVRSHKSFQSQNSFFDLKTYAVKEFYLLSRIITNLDKLLSHMLKSNQIDIF